MSRLFLGRTLAAAALLLMLGATPARANGTDIALNFGGVQGRFNSFAQELGIAVAYNPVAPAETLGVLGFDLGISASFVDIDSGLWNSAVADGDAPSVLVIPRIQARKGLPFGIDVGVSYTRIPQSDIQIIGGEVRKALLKGATLIPAVSVLIHYSALTGVSQLDLTTYGADLAISKGIAFLTPYAGVGQIWIDAQPNVAGLADTTENATRGYVGLKIAPFPFVNLVAQADFSQVKSYTLRINVGI